MFTQLFSLAKNTDFSGVAERVAKNASEGFSDPNALGAIAARINDSLTHVSDLFIYGAYVGGLAFVISAMLSLSRTFKTPNAQAEKEPIGHCFMHLFIGASLIYLPTYLGIAGATLFGVGAEAII